MDDSPYWMDDWEMLYNWIYVWSENTPPLYVAIINNDPLAERLVSEVTDINQICANPAFLEVAAYHKSVSVVKLLLERGANVSDRNGNNSTLLFLACYPNGHTRMKGDIVDNDRDDGNDVYETSKLLLEVGADCNIQVYKGMTPFLLSLSWQPLRVIELLANFGGDSTMTSEGGYTALHLAAENEDVNAINFVIRQGFTSLDILTSEKSTPLSIAIQVGNMEGCQYLLWCGADANLKSGDKDLSPLQLVCESSFGGDTTVHEYIVNLLLDYGAVVHWQIVEAALATDRLHRRMNDSSDYLCGRITGLLIRHVAKVHVLAGCQSFDENVRNWITEDGPYRKYYLKCYKELEKMQSAAYENVRIFHLLTGTRKQLAGYARNYELRKYLVGNDLQRMFPEYFDFIHQRVALAVMRFKLLKKASRFISDCLKLNDWRGPIPQGIVMYFSNTDLEYFK